VRPNPEPKGNLVKQILARFTTVVMVLATLALSLGAGIRWY
jgi:Mg-chelatase subunit ChlI